MRKRTGSIDTTRTGRHRVRLTVNGKRPTVGTFGDRAEAERMLAASLDVLETGAAHDGETLLAWGRRVLTERELSGDVRDPATDWSRWRTHIATDAIAATPLVQLRRLDVREWLGRVAKRLGSPQNVLNLLRTVLGAAVDAELIASNPAAGIRVKKRKRTEEDWTFLTPAEQDALVSSVTGAERWIVAFAIATGLRAGEVVTLRLRDLHLEDAEPHVVVRYGTAPDLATKSGKIRRVELLPHAVDAARAWLAELPLFAPKNPRGLVFPRKRGGFRSEEHVLRWAEWKGALERAGITRPFRWHDLRHTCASSLVSGWWGRAWSLLEVKEWLGHASITTTERYAHLAGTALRRAAEETREQLATQRPPRPQALELAGECAGFLNRWSDVRVVSGPLSESAKDSVVWAAWGDGQLVALSRRLLEAVAAGDGGAHALALELADAVLGAHVVRLALDVSDAGPHTIARAMELAERVLSALGTEADRARRA